MADQMPALFDLARLILVVTLAICLLLYKRLPRRLKRDDPLRQKRDRLNRLVIILAMVNTGMIAALVVSRFDHYAKLMLRTLPPLGLAVVGIAVAFMLVELRKRNLRAYGMAEMAVAAATFAYIAEKFSSMGGSASAVAFAGAVYVFVRGLTNYREGQAKASVPPTS